MMEQNFFGFNVQPASQTDSMARRAPGKQVLENLKHFYSPLVLCYSRTLSFTVDTESSSGSFSIPAPASRKSPPAPLPTRRTRNQIQEETQKKSEEKSQHQVTFILIKIHQKENVGVKIIKRICIDLLCISLFYDFYLDFYDITSLD